MNDATDHGFPSHSTSTSTSTGDSRLTTHEKHSTNCCYPFDHLQPACRKRQTNLNETRIPDTANKRFYTAPSLSKIHLRAVQLDYRSLYLSNGFQLHRSWPSHTACKSHSFFLRYVHCVDRQKVCSRLQGLPRAMHCQRIKSTPPFIHAQPYSKTFPHYPTQLSLAL